MLEVEMKFAIDDFEPLERALMARGAVIGRVRRDADHYFNAPDRDFAKTDEAFRVRSIGNSNFVTYKGPKLDATTKTRLEVEVALADGPETAADFRRLITLLGFRFVAVVEKSRRTAEFSNRGFDIHATLDEVDGVGRYAELEIVAPAEQAEAAKSAILEAASELRLAGSERRSYLQLLLERRGQSKP